MYELVRISIGEFALTHDGDQIAAVRHVSGYRALEKLIELGNPRQMDWQPIATFPFEGNWPADTLLVFNKCAGPELVKRLHDDHWRQEGAFMEAHSHWAVIHAP